MAETQPAEGSFAWFLAQGLDPYTGAPMKPGEELRKPKRSSKRPEPKSAPKTSVKPKGEFVINYEPPRIGQGASRAAGAISVNASAFGPALRAAAASFERAVTPTKARAEALRAAQAQPEIVGGNSTLSTPVGNVRSLADGLRAMRDAMGGPLAGRMVEHDAQQRARFQSGDASPTPMTGETMDLADATAGGIMGSIKAVGGAKKLAAGLRRIKDLKGQLKDAPREFYRGTNPGSTERIRTGSSEWDSYLFAADNKSDAGLYGHEIERVAAKPDARILYEGTKEWVEIAGKWRKDENMLEYANRAAKAAREAGYDAAWFKRQGDIGTPIFNEDAFVRGTGGAKKLTKAEREAAVAAMLAGGMGAMGLAGSAEAADGSK